MRKEFPVIPQKTQIQPTRSRIQKKSCSSAHVKDKGNHLAATWCGRSNQDWEQISKLIQGMTPCSTSHYTAEEAKEKTLRQATVKQTKLKVHYDTFNFQNT